MPYDLPVKCPVCQERFYITRLGCETCGSVLEGNFELGRLARLSNEMQQFVIVFLECRGNIREMEKYFSISYPTVRARIDEIVAALDGQQPANIEVSTQEGDATRKGAAVRVGDAVQEGANRGGNENIKHTRLDILNMLANGEIELHEAQNLLSGANFR